jgi:hypothetical protein
LTQFASIVSDSGKMQGRADSRDSAGLRFDRGPAHAGITFEACDSFVHFSSKEKWRTTKKNNSKLICLFFALR